MEPESFSTSVLLVALHCLINALVYWDPLTEFLVGLYYLIFAISDIWPYGLLTERLRWSLGAAKPRLSGVFPSVGDPEVISASLQWAQTSV